MKKKLRSILALLMAILMVAACTACGSGGNGGTASGSSKLQEVLDRGYLIFVMIRRKPRSTLFPYTTALPICVCGMASSRIPVIFFMWPEKVERLCSMQIGRAHV